MSVLTRRLVAGFLAGASTIFMLVAFVAIMLIAGGIWGALQDVAFREGTGIEGQSTFWGSFGQSLLSLPSFFWSARWAMVALGLLGLPLALVDAFHSRINRPWHAFLGFVVSFGVVTAAIIGFQYASREQLVNWIVDQPTLYSQQGALLTSHRSQLFLGFLVSLAVGYIAWVGWQWWYRYWAKWFRVPRPAAERVVRPVVASTPTSSAASEMIAYQERMARLRRQEDDESSAASTETGPAERPWLRWGLIALAVTTVLAFLVLRLFDSVGPAVASGELGASSVSPESRANIALTRTPQRITVSNTAGGGAASVRLRSSQSEDTIREIERMPFAGNAQEFETATMDLSGLPPGTYQISATMLEEPGGVIRYVALHGGGLRSALTGALFGLLIGLWMALAALVVLELMTNAGLIKYADASEV